MYSSSAQWPGVGQFWWSDLARKPEKVLTASGGSEQRKQSCEATLKMRENRKVCQLECCCIASIIKKANISLNQTQFLKNDLLSFVKA